MTSLTAGWFGLCVGSTGAICGIGLALALKQCSFFLPPIVKVPNFNKAEAHTNKHNRVQIMTCAIAAITSALYSGYSMSQPDGASTMGAFFKSFLGTFVASSAVMTFYRAN